MPASRKSRIVVACAVLVLATWGVYWQVAGFEFINYDDPDYVTRNPMVSSGLTVKGGLWAFTTTWISYWHPLTWLSHMLDCQIFGLNAAGHHLSSVLLHTVNTLLLFLVLCRMTRAWERSAVVAAFFALHPLHVESVAWVAERKDVLSTLFWLLTIWQYIRYVERPRPGRYLLALLFFVLGLMSKPMVVTLPFTLLLLDYWPLRRIQFASGQVRRAFIEKIPFFALAAASCGITFYGVKVAGNVFPLERVPLDLRLANVPISYARYLVKMIWPEGLAVFYPMPQHWPLWQALGATVLVLCLSALALVLMKRCPYLSVGWFWYLGTLVPTVGLVTVGWHSIADRFTYVSLIGLFLAAVWGLPELAARWPFGKHALRLGTALALGVCVALSWLQLYHWRNSVTLWTHTAAVTKNNVMAHYNLGHALAERGQSEAAMEHYQQAIRIQPDHVEANVNLGALYVAWGRLEEATNAFRKALRAKPANDNGHNNMGVALLLMGKPAAASNHFAQAIQLNSAHADAHYNFGVALAKLGHFDRAVTQFREALRLNPSNALAHCQMTNALSAHENTLK